MKKKDKVATLGAVGLGLAGIGIYTITRGLGMTIAKGVGYVGNKVLGKKENITVFRKVFKEDDFVNEEFIEEEKEIIEKTEEEKIVEENKDKIDTVEEKTEEKEIIEEKEEAIKKAQEEMKNTIADTARIKHSNGNKKNNKEK